MRAASATGRSTRTRAGPLPDHEDLHDRPGPLGGVREGPLQVADPAAAAALRALRPRPVQHRRRRRRVGPRRSELTASDAKAASALVASPAFTATSSGYLGASDSWTDLQVGFRHGWRHPVGAAEATSSRPRARRSTGPARQPDDDARPRVRARRAPARSPRPGPRCAAATGPPSGATRRAGTTTSAACRGGQRSAAGHERLYDASLMVMAALEDKTYRGAGIASPSMAWVWGLIPGYSGPYHLVWSRDLYQVATAQIAAGDPGGGRARARPPVRSSSSSPTAASRRTRTSTARATGPTCSSTRSPIRSCWRGSSGAPTPPTWSHVRSAAECILRARSGHPGALGERGRLLARLDRRGDRRPRLRGGDRRAQRSGRRRDPLPRVSRRLRSDSTVGP